MRLISEAGGGETNCSRAKARVKTLDQLLKYWILFNMLRFLSSCRGYGFAVVFTDLSKEVLPV